MTKEEIQLALRLVAHGRVNHPQVEELAEKLAGLLAPKAAPVDFGPPLAQLGPVMNQWVVPPQFAPAGTPDPVQAVKRGPGRPKKAE